MLEIDSTLYFQIANFLILLFFLNIFLYRPIRNILAQRNKETGSLENAIKDYLEQAEQREKGIVDGTAIARKEGHTEKESLKKEGLEVEKDILNEAGASVEDRILIARKEMEKKIADAHIALEDQIASFSREVSEKILGRNI